MPTFYRRPLVPGPVSVTKQQEPAEPERLDTMDPDRWEALVKEAFEADGVAEYRHVWDELMRREGPARMEEARRKRREARVERMFKEMDERIDREMDKRMDERIDREMDKRMDERIDREMDKRMDERIRKDMERRLDEYIQVGIHRDFARDYARHMAGASC